MKKAFQLLSIAALAMQITGCKQQEESIEQQIDNLYLRMTPAERIAQLRGTYLNDYFDEEGHLDTALCRKLIPDGIGHFSQYASQMGAQPEEIRDRVAAMQNWLIHNTPSGIPALFHEEVLTGVCTRGATVYPQQIGYACSFNTELAELKARQTSRAMRQMGGLLSLSPMVDVCRIPSFNRLEESYGEDAFLSAQFGTAFVRGLQQGDLRQGVGTCSKHYLGYGGGGDASEQELMEDILLPHETMIRLAGSQVVMPGYHTFHGYQCAASAEALDDILRQYLGFQGMVVSDYTAIDQISTESDNLHRAVAAINAGTDVDFPRGTCFELLPEALSQGLVTEQTLERAVKRVLRYKAQVGLLDKQPALYANGAIQLDTPQERQTSYQMATQSVVLLQNNGILPLRTPDTENQHLRLFLTGPNANTMWAMLGDYTYQSMRYFWQLKTEDDMHPHIVGLKEGLESRLPAGMQLSYSRGCDWTEGVETWIEEGGDQRAEWMRALLDRTVKHPEKADAAEALQMARQSDVIIAAVGENVLLCGENRERPTLTLPGRQTEYVEQLLATGKPVVLVVFGGRCQIIERIAHRCAAVIQAWYPGEEGGSAVADILYGNVSPSGRLCVSYPNCEIKAEPVCYTYSSFDTTRIAWPFGYGLSYTTFEYSHLETDTVVDVQNDVVRVSFEVRNTGSMAADEVAQLYLAPVGQPGRLQGFARVSLAPGEAKRVSVELSIEQFGHYADRQWVMSPGQFQLAVGASSRDLRLQQQLSLHGTERTKKLREIYFPTISVTAL